MGRNHKSNIAPANRFDLEIRTIQLWLYDQPIFNKVNPINSLDHALDTIR